MAVRKSEIYSSLYEMCDNLRGGMDPSQYKNYILTLLFVKYISDKFKGNPYAGVIVPEGGSFDAIVGLRGKKDIGEKIDTEVLAKISASNPSLSGIFKDVHFNDDAKMGKGEDKVTKITNLINIFLRPEFDFKNQKASGDDILGDAYEYLMRRFAVDSGKSKGQFYTPAEASRILAGLLGVATITRRREGWTIYDPACGSGSLLIRAASEASAPLSIYGQEYDPVTAGLAKMNLVLHKYETGEVKSDNTFTAPQFFEPGSKDEELRRFDFATVNPPFSDKKWTNGLEKEYKRFDGYDARPPDKNGDYAWLMHVIKSLKSTGRAAVILPLGVLFRGNAEETIRTSIIQKGLIEGVVAFPPNIFYGTGIPACVIVIDKAGASTRQGVFMIDASRDFIKDGNKNRLRERDIYKVVSTYISRAELPHYSRFVENDVLRKNGYNLNIPRYIDSSVREDIQSIDAHLNGGIPDSDVEALGEYWRHFPDLKDRLFAKFRKGYLKLKVAKDDVRQTILSDAAFGEYGVRLMKAFADWSDGQDAAFRGISPKTKAKTFVKDPAEAILAQFAPFDLVDKYDAYESLLSYWNETMADDVYAIVDDGYEAGRECADIVEEKFNKKKKEFTKKIVGWEGRIIPRAILDRVYFEAEVAAIEKQRGEKERTAADFDEFVEAETEEGGVLFEYVTKAEDEKEEDDAKVKLEKKRLAADYKKLKREKPQDEETERLGKYFDLEKAKKQAAKKLKELESDLEGKEREKYPVLTLDELKDLIVNSKWKLSVGGRVSALFTAVSNCLAERVIELAERYEQTWDELDAEGDALEKTVKGHLAEMGY